MPVPRPLIEQTFFTATVVVGTVPTPLGQQLNLSSMIDSFILSNPSANGNSVFVGDSGVSLAAGVSSGIEIIAGAGVTWRITQTRQLYELQNPLLVSSSVAACQAVGADMIPVICWNPSNIYLIASIATTIGAMFFRNVYV